MNVLHFFNQTVAIQAAGKRVFDGILIALVVPAISFLQSDLPASGIAAMFPSI
ncbi:MAG: hypothetical protein MUO63_10525 [Desulfobulbaceae bacterium]|nr:hypothetical protein [Desulfobulbaceae bacterium]